MATPLDVSLPKDINAAGRQYVEQFGSVLVTSNYLKIAVLALSVLNVALIVLNIKTYHAFNHLKPLVIRINDVGWAEAVTYDSLQYQPREAEIKYFLMDFVQRHYSRMRATVRENYARSLYFLDGDLADQIIEANQRTSAIEGFLAGSDSEIEVQVHNISIEDLRTPPYKAVVDFEKIYYAPGARQPVRREKFVANFVFVIKDTVPNAMIPVNPLGLTITYFREDQAFR